MFVGFVSVELAANGKVVPSSFIYPGAVAGIFLALHIALRIFLPSADPLLLPVSAGLTFVGMVMIYRLDPGLAMEQVIWIAVAAVSFILVVLLLRNYELLAQYKYTIAVAALLLLASTMILGTEVNGARLWLKIGPLSFQPSELAKILMVIFLAAFFAEKHELLSVSTHRVLGVKVPELKYFGPLLLMWGVSVLMMIFQKDLGSSLLFFGIFICMLYAATSRKSYVFVGLALFLLGAYFCYLSFGHVELRVMTWLHPFNPATIENESYQITQSLFALSSGGHIRLWPRAGATELHPFRYHRLHLQRGGGGVGASRGGVGVGDVRPVRGQGDKGGAYGAGRFRETAGVWPGEHHRDPVVHHHGRGNAADTAYRYNPAIHELRGQLSSRQLHPAGPAADHLRQGCHH